MHGRLTAIGIQKNLKLWCFNIVKYCCSMRWEHIADPLTSPSTSPSPFSHLHVRVHFHFHTQTHLSQLDCLIGWFAWKWYAIQLLPSPGSFVCLLCLALLSQMLFIWQLFGFCLSCSARMHFSLHVHTAHLKSIAPIKHCRTCQKLCPNLSSHFANFNFSLIIFQTFQQLCNLLAVNLSNLCSLSMKLARG